MVATATRTILENLDRLPNEDQRTKVAIIAYDTSIYFFSMSVSVFGVYPILWLQRRVGRISRLFYARHVRC